MDYLLISLTALLVAVLTFFSGFGLGTLLMPAFAVFFPVEIAVAATAVVHLANNLFKVALVGRKADRSVVVKFALPATFAAMAGAALLVTFSDNPPLASYSFFGLPATITAMKLTIGLLILVFALLELSPRFQRLNLPPQWMPVGGVLSGFFGGLSGHQGALRSAFLIRSGLEKEVFIGTTVVSAVLIDLSRLIVYGAAYWNQHINMLQGLHIWGLVGTGTLAALLGSLISTRLLHKTTLAGVQRVIAALLLLTGLALAGGII